ncbi:MAG: hypothetical protein LW870_23200 [Pirellula sp.]|nr:hypothetical protein [Pirellula sp.]
MSQCRSLETNPGLMDCVSCLTDEDPLGRDNGPSLRLGRDDGSSLWFGLNDTFRLRMMRSRQPVAWDHRPERCESSVSCSESCRNNRSFESEDPLGRDNGPSLRLGQDDGSSLWFGLNNSFRLRMMRSRQPVAWDHRRTIVPSGANLLFLAVKVAAIIEASKAKIRWAGTMVPAYDWTGTMVPAYDWAGTMVPAYDWAGTMVPAYGLAATMVSADGLM